MKRIIYAILCFLLIPLLPQYQETIKTDATQGLIQNNDDFHYNSSSTNVKMSPHYQAEVYGDTIYYINNLVDDGDGGAIYKYHIYNETNEKVVSGDILDFKIYGNKLFFNQDSHTDNNLYVLDLKYTDTPMLISNNSARDLVFYNNYLYYVRENEFTVGTEIIKMDLTDFAETSVYSYNVHNIEIYNGKMYFIKGVGMDDIYYGEIDQNGSLTNIKQIETFKTSFFRIDGDFLYMREETRFFGIADYHFTKVNLIDLTSEKLNSDYDTVSFTFANNLVYFTNNVFTNSNDGLYQMTSSANDIVLIKQEIYPKKIIFINNNLYFYNNDGINGDSRFYKLDLDTKNMNTIDDITV